MCIKIIERYAVCQCIYTTHAVDPCSRVGLRDHRIILKEVLVGYTCPRHSATGAQPSSSSTYQPSFPDSGYGSGGYTQQHRAEYRRCWAKTKTAEVLVWQRSDYFGGGSRDWGKIGVCPEVMGVCSMAMWSNLEDIGKNMGKCLWGAGCSTWNLIVPIDGSSSGYFIGNIILLQGQGSQSSAYSLRTCISPHSLHLPSPPTPLFQNAATLHSQTRLGRKIWLAELGISIWDISLCGHGTWTKFMLARSGVRVTTFMASTGLRLGIGKMGHFGGFFLEFTFFAAPFKSHLFHSSEHCSNLYYVLSKNHHLLSALV